MNCKPKNWIWKLTGPFASSNYTVVFGTIFHPKGMPPTDAIFKHEEIHEKQAKRTGGWFIWTWLYLIGFPLGLPFFWNPWRKKWELEAYIKGTGFSKEAALQAISGKAYGWIA